jgi:phosphoribosylformylglycinamidine synthase
MTITVRQFYRKIDAGLTRCFNVESSRPLSDDEIQLFKQLVSEDLSGENVFLTPVLIGERVVEIGPRLNFATAWSANMVSICRAIGLDSITRVEQSTRYLVAAQKDRAEFIRDNHDRMTECVYPEPLLSFATSIRPESVTEVDMIGGGADILLEIPGISMDRRDREFYYDYFVKKHNRNPTIVEIMDLNNANSEHSRHGFFRGKHIIDSQELEGTLFDVVTATLNAHPKGSVIAFKDNSSVITGHGHKIPAFQAEKPGLPAPLVIKNINSHILLTAETHNFPTGVAPFPGAETGIGGRIRDVQATGKGGFVMAGSAGYCVANLHIPGYETAWENSYECPANLASSLEIEIEASNGASDYGNKFGEPIILGFTRSFDLRTENGERWGFLKPIMFTGGIGQIDARHTEKAKEEKGMLIVQVGGPAYRVGFGGGAASSMLQGENAEELDFNAVQRGDAEMEQKMNRVIRACNEMGDKTLVDVIHDQGAGGPANVLKELVEHSGGRIEIRNIRVGDPTMSVLEIYVAEYQERNGFLISPENIKEFQAICQREKVACELLGEVTGDLRFVVHDKEDNSTPVDLELDVLLGDIPQKSFTDTRVDGGFTGLKIPETLTVRKALSQVLRLLSVGSKRFLTNKVDRSVTGLIARQQCCGPLQLPLSNVAVAAQSYFGLSGIATAIGEQPIKMIINPAAGARMAVGEAWTNLLWAKIDDPEQVKCSANWMWAPKLAGEGAALNDAARAMRDAMIATGMAVDGGKDSLSMATMVGDEMVKSPRTLVISAYAAMTDIRKVVTPDLKNPGASVLVYIGFTPNKHRLGGSALAQTLKQYGNDCPDMDRPELVKKGFSLIQSMIDDNLILAGHDISDGGLLVTLLEMAFAGNCGLNLKINGEDDVFPLLFAEELGVIIECSRKNLAQVMDSFHNAAQPVTVLGDSVKEKEIRISCNGQMVIAEDMRVLRQEWEETSYQLERLQMKHNPRCADAEKEAIFDRNAPLYHLPFSPEATPSAVLSADNKPRVAILRDEGSNSDREMAAAFYAAGFEPWDITMTDLLAGKISLASFQGLAAVGGFSYADVPESARGWAATILFNQQLQDSFTEFYERKDTFSLGICNGCQLFAQLGWTPFPELETARRPRFTHNLSGRFESRWSTVRIEKSPAIMLQNMEGMVFGIHVAHGEGRLVFPDGQVKNRVISEDLVPLSFVDDRGNSTEQYPFNPNGSERGFAGLCSRDGRHLAMMPHPERTFLPWQCHYLPENMKDMEVSPWLTMFRNAYEWTVSQ